jgi:iduronate 2-sulfatase
MTSTRIAFAAFVTGLLGASLVAAEPAKRPNVLLIIADDLNRSLPCYGHELVETPNVDRLAARAVRFDRAYCQYPVCSPSRVSFLSGRRPEQTRMFGNEGSSRTPSLQDAVFLPEYFRQQGYFTARVGKVFHIGRDVPECWDVTEEGTPDNKIIYQPQEPDKLALRDRVVAEDQLDGDTGEGGHWYQVDAGEDRLVDPRTANRVSELIEQGVKGGKPFFIACGFRRPHLPWMAPTEYFDLYAPDLLPLPESGDVPRPAGDPKKPAASAQSRRAALRGYYACISFMDRQLGRVLDTLDRNQLWDETVVLLLGDNGYHLGTRGGYWGKGTPYEDSCGVPLLVAAPGMAGASACQRVVEFVDFYPTLVDLCGLPPRGDLEGRSLRMLLSDPTASWTHAAFTIAARNGEPAWLAISTERFRYVEYADGRRPAELYNIRDDPYEWTDLAARPEHAGNLAELRRLAADHRAKYWRQP